MLKACSLTCISERRMHTIAQTIKSIMRTTADIYLAQIIRRGVEIVGVAQSNGRCLTI
jgi:hypothetical protein